MNVFIWDDFSLIIMKNVEKSVISVCIWGVLKPTVCHMSAVSLQSFDMCARD